MIVPLDGSARSARALGPAVKAATALDSPLKVISFATELSRAVVESELEEQLEAARRESPGVECTLRVETSESVGQGLLAYLDSTPGALVVMATHGRGHSSALFGSTAAEVVRHRSSPLLLVGPDCETDRFEVGGLMLVPLDASDHSEQIIPVAEAWAIVFGNPIEVVQVVSPEDSQLAAAASVREPIIETDYVHRKAREMGRALDQELEYEVLHGEHAGPTIVARARDYGAALVAMTTHGASGLSRLLHGSVTADVVRHAPCPVLTVRPASLHEE
ncbi:MAG: universal stress protein [Actinobacteria bacterium]|nr:universal stress protein [Actinomycetota bacterium]